jgi:hypothetical protein
MAVPHSLLIGQMADVLGLEAEVCERGNPIADGLESFQDLASQQRLFRRAGCKACFAP